MYFSMHADFDYQEQLDEYIDSLPDNRTNKYIREQLSSHRAELPSKADWDLIPEIVNLVNTLGDLRPELYKTRATRVFFDDHPNCYLTDNWQKLGKDLRAARIWLLKEVENARVKI